MYSSWSNLYSCLKCSLVMTGENRSTSITFPVFCISCMFVPYFYGNRQFHFCLMMMKLVKVDLPFVCVLFVILESWNDVYWSCRALVVKRIYSNIFMIFHNSFIFEWNGYVDLGIIGLCRKLDFHNVELWIVLYTYIESDLHIYCLILLLCF